MNLLTALLFFTVSGGGTAETGNPMTPLTDEEQIKLVMNNLEDALLKHDSALVTACLSERLGNKALAEVKNNYITYAMGATPMTGMPLVYLRTFDVKVEGNTAQAKVEAFTYGAGKRIQATHKVEFRKTEYGWLIADAKPLNAMLKQVGGIAPTANTTEQQVESETTESQPKTNNEVEQ
ncbi:hypothetical protein GX441_04845 [bacterium]|nr:hypothetical protein [bacterium]